MVKQWLVAAFIGIVAVLMVLAALAGVVQAQTSSRVGNLTVTNTADFSNTSLVKQRVAAALTTSVNGDCGYDSTNQNWHCWNGADAIVPLVPVSALPTNGQIGIFTVSSGKITLNGGAGPLLLGNGSASAPTYSFSANTNQGLFSANNLPELAVGGFGMTAWDTGGQRNRINAVVGWSSSAANPDANANDTGISRCGIAIICFGNGIQGDNSAQIAAQIVTWKNQAGTQQINTSLPAGTYSVGQTLQPVNDTFVYRASTDTLTGKSYNSEGTGNSLQLRFYTQFSTAYCIGASAFSFWDLPSSNSPVANCLTGTNANMGTLDFDHVAARTAQTDFLLPPGWTGNVDVDIAWLVTSGGGSNTVKFTVATACSAPGATYDTAFNTANTLTTGTVAANNIMTTTSQTAITMTGCAAGNTLHLKLGRDVTDSFTGTVRVVTVGLTLRRVA